MRPNRGPLGGGPDPAHSPLGCQACFAESLIPVRQRRRRHPGRKAISDRLVLNGILHVLHTGIAWEDLPQEYGYGSGVTAWRRLRDWQAAGVWEALHQRLLVKLNAAGAIDWSRASVDGSAAPGDRTLRDVSCHQLGIACPRIPVPAA